MFRSAERRPARRLAVAPWTAVLVLGLGMSALPQAASADPSDSAPVQDVVAPTSGIVAPVLDIQLATSDLKREARVEKTPRNVKVTLDATVLFAKDKAAIRPGAARRLHEVAADLKSEGPGRVRIVGYTDDLGTAAHGLDLSRRRARAVAAVLRRTLPETGYAFTVVGKGEADPAVPNNSEHNRRINRRVVITYQAR